MVIELLVGRSYACEGGIGAAGRQFTVLTSETVVILLEAVTKKH